MGNYNPGMNGSSKLTRCWSPLGVGLLALPLGSIACAQTAPQEGPPGRGGRPGAAEQAGQRTAVGDRIRDDRGVQVKQEGLQPGWTLFSPLKSNGVYLVDADGELQHTWATKRSPGNSVYLLDDASLLRCTQDEDQAGFTGGGIGGRLQRYAPDGAVLLDLDLSEGDHCHHHDVEPLPNGNVLGIFWERKSIEELLAMGADPELIGDNDEFWPDAIYEIKPTGKQTYEVVWSWHVWDHLMQDMDRDQPHYGMAFDDPHRVHLNGSSREPEMTAAERERLIALGYLQPSDDDAGAPDSGPTRTLGRADWLHSNGIDYLPELDLIVLSVRSLNEIWFIDHSTTSEQAKGSTGGRFGRGGDLLFRWGNLAAHGMGNIEDQKLFAQHDARFVSGDDKHVRVTVFNNGRGRPLTEEPYSSVEEIVIPLTDGAFPPLDPDGVAQVRHRTLYGEKPEERRYASFISGASLQPNGNLLVCYGDDGRVREISPEGELLWEYLQPYESVDNGRGGGPRGRGHRPAGGPPGGGPPPGANDASPRGSDAPADQRGGDQGAGEAPQPVDGAPQDDRPAGGPPRGGPPQDGQAPGGGPRGNRGGGGGPSGVSLFRATRVPAQHPGLVKLQAYLVRSAAEELGNEKEGSEK